MEAFAVLTELTRISTSSSSFRRGLLVESEILLVYPVPVPFFLFHLLFGYDKIVTDLHFGIEGFDKRSIGQKESGSFGPQDHLLYLALFYLTNGGLVQ